MIDLNFNIGEKENVLNSLSISSEENISSESSEENTSSESSEGSSNSAIENFYTNELMLNCILKYINKKEPINHIPLYREILKIKIYDMIKSNYDYFMIDCKVIFNNNDYLDDSYILNLVDNHQLYIIYNNQLLEAIAEESNWIYENIQVYLQYTTLDLSSSKSYRVFITRVEEIEIINEDYSRLYTPRKRRFK